MKIKLQRVGMGIGLILPQEVLVHFKVKAGDICTLVVIETGIKVIPYDLESEQMKVDYEQGAIEYLNTLRNVGDNTIGTTLPQEVLVHFDLEVGDTLPLVIMEDGIQLLAARKPKSQQRKGAYQSRDTGRRGGWGLDTSGRPMGWWLDDYAD